MIENELRELSGIIGYEFKNTELLAQAMMHSSYINERKIRKTNSYERLEYLGDAVLELIVSEYLFSAYPNLEEGKLSKMRASLVSEHCLSQCSTDLQYPKYVMLGKGEAANGGANRESLLCDLFESVLGAIYLDGGMEPAKTYVHRFLLTDIEHKHLFKDAKTELQERVQAKGFSTPEYIKTGETGPDHAKTFSVEVVINGESYGTGEGMSQKKAEQDAAAKALKRFR